MTEAKTTTKAPEGEPGTTVRTLTEQVTPLSSEQQLQKQRDLAEKHLKRAQAEPEEVLGDPPGNLYFWYSREGEGNFIAPATSADNYRTRGIKPVGYELIDDMPSFLKGQMDKNTPKDAQAKTPEPATTTAKA
jgi:hypothetical protein